MKLDEGVLKGIVKNIKEIFPDDVFDSLIDSPTSEWITILNNPNMNEWQSKYLAVRHRVRADLIACIFGDHKDPLRVLSETIKYVRKQQKK